MYIISRLFPSKKSQNEICSVDNLYIIEMYKNLNTNIHILYIYILYRVSRSQKLETRHMEFQMFFAEKS